MSESAYKTMEIDGDGLLMASFSHEYDLEALNEARQTFPTTYTPNGYVDVLSCNQIRESGKIHGNRVKAYMTETVIELDTLEELRILELQLKLNLEPLERLFSNHVF
jgi:N-acylneuraminate cytidylyltransferase